MKVAKEVSSQVELNPCLLQLLEVFWSEMHQWETRCNAYTDNALRCGDDLSPLKITAIPALAGIFSRHCCGSVEPRRTANGTLYCQSPAEYNPDLDELVSVLPNRTGYTIRVQGGGEYGMLFEYKVLSIQGQLKLLDKRVLICDDHSSSSGL